MITITVSEARKKFFGLINRASRNHEPVQIKGRRKNAVLVSEEDWHSIQEMLYLLSIPGMRESIRNGMKTPLGRCGRKPGW